MDTYPAFHKWVSNFERLSDTETLALPAWQRVIAYLHQFLVDVTCDGAGSLFYNHAEKIEHVATSFEVLGERDLVARIRQIETILQPLVEDGPPNIQDILIKACLEGAAVDEVSALEADVSARFDSIYVRLEAMAKLNGWTW